MKKIIFLLFIAGSIVSCKKKYTCNCTSVISYTSSSPDTYKNSSVAYSEKMTEKQAKSACAHEGVSIDATFTNAFTNNGAGTPSAFSSTGCELVQ